MKQKTLFFTITLLFLSLNANAQLHLLASPRHCNEALPLFCEKYNIPDSIRSKLIVVSLKFIENNKTAYKKYYGDNPKAMIAPGSPFTLEIKELIATRDTQIENLLGRKMTNNLEMYLKEFSFKLREEAIQNLKKKKGKQKNIKN